MLDFASNQEWIRAFSGGNRKKSSEIKLFQPPLFSDIHSLRVPLLKGPLLEVVLRAAPRTGKHSKVHKLSEDIVEPVDEVNIVLIKARDTYWSAIHYAARTHRLKVAGVRHLCSLLAAKPLLHHELVLDIPLVSVLATETVRLKDEEHIERVPIAWWLSEMRNPEKPPEHIASLFWFEEVWDYPYWFAFVKTD